MRVEVYEPHKEPEKVLRLALFQDNDGASLIAVDVNGHWIQEIARFSHQCDFTRWPLGESFVRDYGIKVDEKRRIRLCDS